MKVSIITVVYNNREHIADCIRSVMSQSYPNIEHIVIDGGSTDGTQEEIKPYKHRLAHYRSEKDRGLYNALNKGILQAKGDVIGILHSDDLFYDQDTIRKVVTSFQQSDASLIYGNGLFVDREDTDEVKRVYKAKPFRRRNLVFGWIPLHTTIYVKREVFEEHGLYFEHFSIASDYEISLRWFLETSIKKHFHEDYVVKMRIGGKSTTANLQRRKGKEDISIIYQHDLPGFLTLAFKIGRKIPQYIKPKLVPWRYKRKINNLTSFQRSLLYLSPSGRRELKYLHREDKEETEQSFESIQVMYNKQGPVQKVSSRPHPYRNGESSKVRVGVLNGLNGRGG